MSAPLLCAKCARPVQSYFKIERIDRDGQSTVTAITCSIPCLLQWGMNYAAMVGTMGVMKAKNVVDQVVDLFRGGPKRG